MTQLPLKLLTIGILSTGIFACNSSDDETTPTSTEGIQQLAAATPASLTTSCNELANNLNGLDNTEIMTSTEAAAGELSVAGKAIRAHCVVTGKMFERVGFMDGNTYAIHFEMRLPIEWNGRFFHQGNGGIDGRVSKAIGNGGPGGLTNALYQGFAVLSSDAGHNGTLGPTFGIDPVARLDYGYTSAAKLTPIAKELLELAYGKRPDRSYFGGCSNGGRHAFNAFSRMPDEYDGYLAGAPGYRLPYAAIANIFGAQRYREVASDPADIATAFTDQERAMVAAAVLEKCDALDGVADGQIFDVQACQAEFTLDDVATCTNGRNGSCLSAAQKIALGAIYNGAVTSDGDAFYAPFPFDTGIATKSYAHWEFTVPVERDSGAVAFIWSVPAANPATFNGEDFALNGSVDEMLVLVESINHTYTEAANQFMVPPNNGEELAAVRDRGAKIMVYHGMSDPIFSPLDSVNWYRNVDANSNGAAADFARLYLIPGMGHCGGGPAPDQVDFLTPLVQWVEQGIAPDNIVASARGAGNPAEVNTDLPGNWAANRTRPVCHYPLVARYQGGGNIESSTSFSCEP